MRTLTLAILTACSLTLAVAIPLRAETAADLPKLVAEAAQYQSGQNIEALQKLEQLLRDSASQPALRGELEAAALKLLAPNATFEARRFACKLLAVVGSDASLPSLAQLLNKDETVGIACLALSGRRSPKVNEVLRNALATAGGASRLQLMGALGSHQDDASVKTLAGLARDGDPMVADTAILALAKIGTASAHEAIAALRKDARPAQARMVVEATQRVAEQLAASGDRKAAAAIYTELLQPASAANVRRGALAALLQLDQDGGQERILATLRGGDPALMPVAIARVAALKANGVSETFAALLPQLPPAAQGWMIEALASRGDAAARRAIRAQIGASDSGVRRAAIAAVGKLEDASAVPPLVKAMAAAQSPEELQNVEIALVSLRGGAATDAALVAELKQASGDAKIRLFAVVTRRGARAAVPVLLAEAEDADVATVQAALRALGKLAAASDAPALLAKLASLKAADARSEAETAAARALAKIADVAQRSQTVRLALTRAGDVEARCSLLRLLPTAADAESLAALKAATAVPDAQTRDAAVRALVAWPDATGWEAILAVFSKPEKGAHRTLALRALVRLAGDMNAKPDAALVDRYRQLLAGARDDGERKLILGALAGVAHPDALQVALPLVSNAGVRAEAELAVRKIAASVEAQHPKAAQDALQQLNRAKR